MVSPSRVMGWPDKSGGVGCTDGASAAICSTSRITLSLIHICLADAFDADKPAWSAEYSELKELLTPEEYAAARASTLNAHYTSPTVIRAIYEAVERMGFRTGNILEPSMGVGNFFGMLPESMAESRLYGVCLLYTSTDRGKERHTWRTN